MRYPIALGFVLYALVAPALSSEGGHHPPGHGSRAAGPASFAEGVVKKVDKAAGKITLSHGPLANLGMPGMTMAFAVREPAWLESLKAGDKVRFQAERVKGAYTVVQMDPVR